MVNIEENKIIIRNFYIDLIDGLKSLPKTSKRLDMIESFEKKLLESE